MWIVVKYKSKEYKTLKESFFRILGEMPEFYNPKIKFEKNLLDNYLMCRHYKFNDTAVINLLKNSRGLTYLLNGHEFNQKEISDFIKFCKSKEDLNGFLTQSFFNISKRKKAKFISGPFTQLIFDIVENKGKKLKIVLNNLNMTIGNNSNNYLYSCI